MNENRLYHFRWNYQRRRSVNPELHASRERRSVLHRFRRGVLRVTQPEPDHYAHFVIIVSLFLAREIQCYYGSVSLFLSYQIQISTQHRYIINYLENSIELNGVSYTMIGIKGCTDSIPTIVPSPDVEIQREFQKSGLFFRPNGDEHCGRVYSGAGGRLSDYKVRVELYGGEEIYGFAVAAAEEEEEGRHGD